MNYKITKLLILLISLILVSIRTFPIDFVARVNLIFEDKTIMMYIGSETGTKEGDVFDVYRYNEVIGRVQITKVSPTFSYAKIVQQDKPVEMGDLLAKSPEPKLAKTITAKEEAKSEQGKGKKEKAEEKKEEKKTEKTEKKTTKEKTSKTEISIADDKKKTKDSIKKKETKEKETKKAATTKETKSTKQTPKDSEMPPPQTPSNKDILSQRLQRTYSTVIGLTGGILNPTAQIAKYQRGILHGYLLYSEVPGTVDLSKTTPPQGTNTWTWNAWNDVPVHYRNETIGITYALGKEVEAAYSYFRTRSTNFSSSGYANTDIYSIKYVSEKGFGFFENSVKSYNYGLGVTYWRFGRYGNYSSSANNYNMTRIFGLSAIPYERGIAHLGVYYQTGNAVRHTPYYRWGYMGGYEFLLGRNDHLRFALEYDDKSMYGLEATSAALHINVSRFGALRLGVIDVLKNQVYTFGGDYAFY